ncbi:MAG: hypothetical protein HDR50_04900 [Desulfovibrio sp.]|uniref:hypothetical protein n=1 Tax=Desulfovibrio sp. TaxID=885 RepID=UPI001A67DDDC|nr:hypothetical protein [Desulfovibrio sp.]MBD5416993.1 hypothetical protein [Desulfovibrio sp.]
MRQLSLLDDIAPMAGVMAEIRAAMRAVAGAPDGEGRKALPDKINAVAAMCGIKLTGGNTRAISKDTLDKWLSPSDESHPPSVLALLAFVAATGDPAPLRAMLRAVGLDVMTDEDRRYRDLGKLDAEMRAARKRRKMLEAGLHG